MTMIKVCEGLTIKKGQDGTRLNFSSLSGQHACLCLENQPPHLSWVAIREWAKDRLGEIKASPTVWREYKRVGLTEMTPYIDGMDVSDVSIATADLAQGSPTVGDMIARNPENHMDMWLVSEKYFKENLEEFI